MWIFPPRFICSPPPLSPLFFQNNDIKTSRRLSNELRGSNVIIKRYCCIIPLSLSSVLRLVYGCQDYTAKLSDFGLAKDGPEGDKTHVSTRVMGTYGYAAPEYVMTGHLTSRSDVYSFGVVLLEMLTGRRSVDKNRPSGEQNLVEWARPYLNDKRKLYKLIDPRLEGQFSVKGAQKAAILSHHCLSREPKLRPLMGDVVDTLKPLQDMRDMASSSSVQISANYRSTGMNGHGGGRPYHNGHGQNRYEQLRNIPVRATGASPVSSY